MSWKPVSRDFELEYGAVFTAEWQLYADPRITKNRGLWNKRRVYEKGEAVELADGSGYVALGLSEYTVPGSPGSTATWSPLVPRNLTGCIIDFVCGTLFTIHPPFGATTGRIEVTIMPELFAEAPSSEKYHIKVTEENGVPSYVGNGTLLFKQP